MPIYNWDEKPSDSFLKISNALIEGPQQAGTYNWGQTQPSTVQAGLAPETYPQRSISPVAEPSYTMEQLPDRPGMGGFIADVGTAILSGGKDIFEMGARALRAFDQPGGTDVIRSLTTPVIEGAEELERDYPEYFRQSRQAQEGAIRGAVVGGIRSFLPSVAFAIPGFLGGAIPGAALTAGGVFAAAEVDKYLEDAGKNGISRADAIPYAIASGAIEGGGEAIADLIGLKLLGFGANKLLPWKATVKDMLKSYGGSVLKNTLKQMPVEVGTEMGQNFGEAWLRKKQGMSDFDPVSEAVSAIGPTIVMTMLFGAASKVYMPHVRARLANSLTDSNVDPTERLKVANLVTDSIKKEDPMLAQQWQKYVLPKIENFESIPIDLNIADFVADSARAEEEEKPSEVLNNLIATAVSQPEARTEAVGQIIQTLTAKPFTSRSGGEVLPLTREDIPPYVSVKKRDLAKGIGRSGGAVLEETATTTVQGALRPSITGEPTPTPDMRPTAMQRLRGELTGRKGRMVPFGENLPVAARPGEEVPAEAPPAEAPKAKEPAEEGQEFIYKSPMRPLWIGFGSALGQEYRSIDERTFATKKPLSEEKIYSLELKPVVKEAPRVEEEVKEAGKEAEEAARGRAEEGEAEEVKQQILIPRRGRIPRGDSFLGEFHLPDGKVVNLHFLGEGQWKLFEAKAYGRGETVSESPILQRSDFEKFGSYAVSANRRVRKWRLTESGKTRFGFIIEEAKAEEVKPTATFLGMQETAKGNIPLYNVKGGKLDKSTVSRQTLVDQGIEVPETPEAPAKKVTEEVTPQAEELDLDEMKKVYRQSVGGETGYADRAYLILGEAEIDGLGDNPDRIIPVARELLSRPERTWNKYDRLAESELKKAGYSFSRDETGKFVVTFGRKEASDALQAEAQAETEVKEPWEMGHVEFIKYAESNSAFAEKYDKKYGSYNIINWALYVEDAVKAGKPVPEYVLDEALLSESAKAKSRKQTIEEIRSIPKREVEEPIAREEIAAKLPKRLRDYEVDVPAVDEQGKPLKPIKMNAESTLIEMDGKIETYRELIKCLQ